MTTKAALILGVAIVVGFALLGGILNAGRPSETAAPDGSGAYQLVESRDAMSRVMVETSTGRVFQWGGNAGTWIEQEHRRPWAGE